jgi:hypothetical protein
VRSAERGARRTSVGEAAAIAQVLGRWLDEVVRLSEAATFEPPPMAGLGGLISREKAGVRAARY